MLVRIMIVLLYIGAWLTRALSSGAAHAASSRPGGAHGSSAAMRSAGQDMQRSEHRRRRAGLEEAPDGIAAAEMCVTAAFD